jgi:hypothetical protein
MPRKVAPFVALRLSGTTNCARLQQQRTPMTRPSPNGASKFHGDSSNTANAAAIFVRPIFNPDCRFTGPPPLRLKTSHANARIPAPHRANAETNASKSAFSPKWIFPAPLTTAPGPRQRWFLLPVLRGAAGLG